MAKLAPVLPHTYYSSTPPRLLVTCTVVLVIIATTTKAAVIANDHDDDDEDYVIRSSSREEDYRPEKLTHFRLYWQNDATRTPNATDVTIIPPVSNSSAGLGAMSFGAVDIIDDPLTAGPSLNSTLVARAQGMYARTSQRDAGDWVVMNFAFLRGKYNGSTLAVLGRNLVTSPTRELSAVGGSGVFRMARGYALLTTYFFDPAAGIAVVEYNVYVAHY